MPVAALALPVCLSLCSSINRGWNEPDSRANEPISQIEQPLDSTAAAAAVF